MLKVYLIFMNIFQSIFLGILQGLTEFLPISSSGHLVIFQKIFRLPESPIFFDTVVHLATVFAIFIFFRKKFLEIFNGILKEIKRRKIGENIFLFSFLFFGSLPIIVGGLFLEKRIENIFNSLVLVGISFFITSLILFLTVFFQKREKEIKNMNIFDSIFIGFFQAMAILPGVSRSGVTISAGFFRKLKPKDAFEFSFFLGIIAILGASVLQFKNITTINGGEILNSIIGFLFAFIFGLLALKILKPILEKGKFYYFGFYCMILGIFCLVLYFIL